MAIRSPINPQTIVRERQATMPAAMNFISGGSPLGSSIVSSAANKIVGFQRGGAAVAPRPSDLGSIIQTLSSSILNNVETKVQSINQNVSNIVNQTLKSFSKDYQDRVKQIDDARPNPAEGIKALSSNIITNVENKVQSITENVNNVVNQSLKTFGQDYQDRIKQVDDAKPSGILANFLKLYQQAIGFIQFLGNRKNVKTLGDNLQVIQRIFTETFEVAKIIRQTIIKIVKQLSNLPTASTGGGGLNLDIKVPGGPLKRSAPKGMMNMLKMAGTGAAIAGGSALAVNALSGGFGGGEVQAAPGSGSEGLSGPILDRFNIILDRFSAAIDSLSKKKSAPARPPASSGSGGSIQEKKDPDDKTAGGVKTGTGSSSAGENIAAFTATLEATGDQDQADVMQVMINRAKGDPTKLAHEVTGRAQFTPMSSAIYGATGHDKAADAAYGHIAPLLGKTPEERKSNLYKLAEGPEGLNNLDKLFKTKNAAQASKVLNDFKTGGTLSAKSQADIAGGRFFKGMNSNPGGVYLQRGPRSNKFHTLNGQGGRGDTTYRLPVDDSIAKGVAKPGVAPATTPATTTQQIAQTVAQPAQQQPQVNVLPINLGNQQQQPQKPASSGAPQPAQMSSGRQAPSMNASNDDNFLTLYSKMVYNIVDG